MEFDLGDGVSITKPVPTVYAQIIFQFQEKGKLHLFWKIAKFNEGNYHYTFEKVAYLRFFL